MKRVIGAYEAKTRLPELLREVRAGRRFTITNRGEAIADLVPSESRSAPDAEAAIDRFQAFLEANPPKGPAAGDIEALLQEGRE